MSDDRTRPPSKRRRQLAREHGQVAHSPELTAAAGWLVAIAVLSFFGRDLACALIDQLRCCLSEAATTAPVPSAVASRVRDLLAHVAWPLSAVLGAFAAGALAAHQLQVRGLWATPLILPDPARLWVHGNGGTVASRFGRAASAALKAAILVVALYGVTRARWRDVLLLSELEPPILVLAASRLLFQLAMVLAGVLLSFGLCDFGLRYFRFEAMLHTTAEEHREDQRMMEGDPVSRAQRRRIARSWRGESPELLTGASLVLVGSGGLTVVLSGGPPPLGIRVRTAATGEAGMHLRRSALARKIPHVDGGDLARRLARRSSPGLPLDAAQMDELTAIWPGR
jgi:flagellar biosynthetic protein FlhB